MDQRFAEFAKAIRELLEQTSIPAKEAGTFVMLRQFLVDIEQRRLTCVPTSELEPPEPQPDIGTLAGRERTDLAS